MSSSWNSESDDSLFGNASRTEASTSASAAAAITREVMNRPVRITTPVLVTSVTSTMPRLVLTSTRRPWREAVAEYGSRFYDEGIPVHLAVDLRTGAFQHWHANAVENRSRPSLIRKKLSQRTPRESIRSTRTTLPTRTTRRAATSTRRSRTPKLLSSSASQARG